uniref:hypothetical protein n=1 Tax=Klebsiella pneumoniae TaxID=573 RepID=UPI00272E3AB4
QELVRTFLRDICVVGDDLLFMTMLYSRKSHFSAFLTVVGTLVIFILAPAPYTFVLVGHLETRTT